MHNRVPLSFNQESLWFIDKLYGSAQYHISTVVEFSGSLNVDVLEMVFQEIVNRHEILRTVIDETDSMLYQRVLEVNKWKLTTRTVSEGDINIDAIRKLLLKSIIEEPFKLSEDHMLRVCVLNSDQDRFLVVIVLHHIAADGWSMSILMREVMSLYSSKVIGKSVKLPDLRFQYRDYAHRQREESLNPRYVKGIAYWKNKLTNVEILNLRTDFPRSSSSVSAGGTVMFELCVESTAKLKRIALENRSTVFMALLAAFKILLFRYTGESDICVGSVYANRTKEESENLVGFFANTVALRNKVVGSASFTEVLLSVRNTILDAYDYQDIPFEKVVESLTNKRDLDRNPLFEIMFSLNNVVMDGTSVDAASEVALLPDTSIPFSPKFELLVSLNDTGEIIRGKMEFRKNLFNTTTIERMAAHYRELINSILTRPTARITTLAMLSKDEASVPPPRFDFEKISHYKNETVIGSFERQVANFPDQIAIVLDDQEISYKELNRRSNQLANVLRKDGLERGSLIGVCLENPIEMVLSTLAVQKIGCAYVPIDPTYPTERIRYIIDDSNCPILIASESCKRLFVDYNQSMIRYIESGVLPSGAKEVENIAMKRCSRDLLYVIYTSGSTGMPKGSMVEDGNVVQLFNAEIPFVDFNENHIWSLFHSFSFDFSVWEMYGALIFGNRLVIVPRRITVSPNEFVKLLEQQCVTILSQTPSAFYSLQESAKECLPSLVVDCLIFGGEALNPSKIHWWREMYPDCKLINMYGITETTVHVTFKELTDSDISKTISNIGRPISTLRCYVLDSEMNVVPLGIGGELYIGGLGVTRGYLNRPTLTKEKFIVNPFDDGFPVLYKTGDIARIQENGDLEYLGRIDDQVKIRGFRIEIGEIERIALENQKVQDVIILPKKDAGGNYYLICYIKSQNDIAWEVQGKMKETLPHFMIPSFFVVLPDFPLTASGKIDKRKLPDPGVGNPNAGPAYVAPDGEVEKKFIEIWESVLGRRGIGVNDNFFEIGGNSIKIAQMINLVNKSMKRQITVLLGFTLPTVRMLSSYYSSNDNESPESGEAFQYDKEIETMNNTLNLVRDINSEQNE